MLCRAAGPGRVLSVWVVVALWLFALGPVQASALVKTPHVTAELVAERSAVLPGEALQIGLRLLHIPHWHTYWRNPGDSGLATTIQWTLPLGSSTGEIEWPTPKRLPLGPLVNYGYEDEVLLPVRFTAPSTALPGSTLTLRAQANWLVCNDVCIPESATLELQLPVVAAGTTPGSTAFGALFERAAAELSTPLREWKLAAQTAGREVLLTLQPESAEARALIGTLPEVHIFPFVEQVFEPAQHEAYRTPTGYAVKLRLMDGMKLPDTLDGLAVLQDGSTPAWGSTRRAAEFSAAVTQVAAITLPEGAQRLGKASHNSASTSSASTLGGGASLGWLTALALAFVGGMVLNLMPCVFPVLSIKLLSLAQHHDSPHTLRTHAWAYTAGVVLSFLALAGVLLALREAGSAIGWGFQLQEPGVVFVLALLFFVIGLNLMGAFEFGAFVPQGLATWRSQRPSADAFAAGVLAVVAASPCTAPFMGAALGFAITQPAAVGLSVFAVLGLGMALPYVLLVLSPGWRERLPRPGPWMLRLKQLLAFPMFATVVWLVWVLGQQAGIDGAGAVLMALVGVAFVLWLGGLPASRGVVGKLVGVALLAGLLVWAWPTQPATDGHGAASGAEAAWLPYDEAVIEQKLAQGQPVFVDFTAAWCVSCQVNKRLVLHRDETMAAFNQANVALMRADWTHRDERITAALAKLGRNGVPVYLLLRPGREPLLLPEVLTQGLVRDALATLNKAS